uniref:NADH dehydrogenase subunit 4L n=1 Tax=Pseudunio homsensis TaxID=1985456 RepID=UPI002551D133|nr:NADH dehydrogenase subunit 4L [Margaritifera homsensis]WGM81364.1 NADH dehydrogenase subunit 4L [Margaritifera homsensis]
MSMVSLLGVGVIGVVLGCICLVSQRKSLFGVLLSMEIFTLGIYAVIISVFWVLGELGSLCLVFLTFGVCEAALGLSVLVSLVRGVGGDYVGGLTSGHF